MLKLIIKYIKKIPIKKIIKIIKKMPTKTITKGAKIAAKGTGKVVANGVSKGASTGIKGLFLGIISYAAIKKAVTTSYGGFSQYIASETSIFLPIFVGIAIFCLLLPLLVDRKKAYFTVRDPKHFQAHKIFLELPKMKDNF